MSTIDIPVIERGMIEVDASFMIGLFLAARQLPEKSDIPYLFSSIDFYSLIVYEAYTYYKKRNPAFARTLKHKYESDIKQSRQRMKLYDDNKLGIEGIGKTLLDTITPAHQRELSKSHPIKLPKWMWEDIGLYFVEGNPVAIGSTHLASFNLGIDVVRMFDPTTATEFGKELGRFLTSIAKSITLVRLPALTITPQDIRSEKIYVKDKYGSPSKVVNAGLSIVDMNMNFMALCLPPSTQHPPILKWKFLTTYHAVSSFRMLVKSPYAEGMNTDKIAAINMMLGSDFAQLLEGEGAAALRNTLTHYGIDTRLDRTKLNMQQRRLYGLVEASLTGWAYEYFAIELDTFIKERMINIFGAW